MFADRAKIILRSGKGGDGHISFRREKYVPNGGPDGGDGGKGGDVIMEIDPGLNQLSDYRHRRKFSATDGEEGGKKRCHGKNGTDLVLKVPEGTVVKDEKTGKVIADLSGDNKRIVILRGGNGGLGNMHFATSTMQAPKYAKPGGDAVEAEVILELKLLADVGLVGFPNVGKSTLLSRVSNASPEIANYHFTTLSPFLGVVDVEGGGFVMADIPGLIEGAANGVGLGFEFLRHIERTRVLLHITDGASVEGRDPVADIKAINAELKQYDEELLKKPQFIVLNKMDAAEDGGAAITTRIKEAFPDTPVYSISAVTGEGVNELIYDVNKLLLSMPKESIVYESEYDPMEASLSEEPVTCYRNDSGEFVAEGPKLLKMLGYTNLDSEKGFLFFQRFMEEQGIIDEFKRLGLKEGDTVRLYDLVFEYME